MFTKEEILCGTIKELTDYIYDTYKLLPRPTESMELPNANYDAFADTNVKTQIMEINNKPIKTGIVFYLHVNDYNITDGTPEIIMQLNKIWIHIREEI